MRDIIADILAREGGYVDDPHDRGGATNFGITQATLAAWRNDPHADPKTLGEEEAKQILQSQYMLKPGFDKLPPTLQEQMVDFGVHSGPMVAIRHLQAILGVEVDGILGPKTLAAIPNHDMRWLCQELVKSRVLMIGRIVAKSPSQAKFLNGWLTRVLSFLR